MKIRLCILIVIFSIFINSICFAASESAKNWMAASPLIGTVLGMPIGAVIGGHDGDRGLGCTLIGGAVGLVVTPILFKNTLKNTDGIRSGYVILGALGTTALTSYIWTKLKGSGIGTYNDILILIAAAYLGGRIGVNQTAIVMPIANIRF